MTIATGEQATAADVLAIKINTQSDVTASQACDTVYQNTSGKPMHVSVAFGANVGTQSAYTGSANPPTVLVAQGLLAPTVTRMTFHFIVLPSYYYKITTVDGISGQVFTWIEWT